MIDDPRYVYRFKKASIADIMWYNACVRADEFVAWEVLNPKTELAKPDPIVNHFSID